MPALGSVHGAVKRFSAFLNTVVTWLTFVLITVMTLTITVEVVFRVFFSALTWTEELSRYLLVWSSFLAASIGFYRGSHIAVTFAVAAFKGRVRRGFSILAYLLAELFFIVGLVHGINLIGLQVFQISPALGLPMKYIYAVIPASFTIMAIHTLDKIMDELAGMAVKTASAVRAQGMAQGGE